MVAKHTRFQKGVQSTFFSLPSQLVTTTGTEPPSSIIKTIQSTGRLAILRGSGAPNSAAVCILELPPSHLPSEQSSYSSPIRGLVRLIQLTPNSTLLDLSLSRLLPGTYTVTLRQSGDISRGAKSMGQVFHGGSGEFGTVAVDRYGEGNMVREVKWGIAEMVGRGVIVRRVDEDVQGGPESKCEKGDDGVLVGVVARSAGAWENGKVVCACSGKTVWEEREEMAIKGVV